MRSLRKQHIRQCRSVNQIIFLSGCQSRRWLFWFCFRSLTLTYQAATEQRTSHCDSETAADPDVGKCAESVLMMHYEAMTVKTCGCIIAVVVAVLYDSYYDCQV